jgi:hypothetical protein
MESKSSIQDSVRDSLSDALFRANHSKGILIIMAMDDDSLFTFSAGDFVTKLGLFEAARRKVNDLWESSVRTSDE